MKELLILLATISAVFAGIFNPKDGNIVDFFSKKNQIEKVESSNTPSATPIFMKDVGEAFMDNFGLTSEDFKIMKESGVSIIAGNFDICAEDEDIQYFLDEAQKAGIKVVLPAGAGEAEWGYKCDGAPYPKNQVPVWNREGVKVFVDKWKSHPALLGWDISNEAGSVFPNANWDTANDNKSTSPTLDQSMWLTAEKLKVAYQDVKSWDPNHEVMMRMNGWFFYEHPDNPFLVGNPFSEGITDVVMLNAYSNVEEYFPNFVEEVVAKAYQKLHEVDPKVKVSVSLGVWAESPIWVKPSADHLKSDISQLKKFPEIVSYGFFKYGAKGSEWYLPDQKLGAPELLGEIKNLAVIQQ